MQTRYVCLKFPFPSYPGYSEHTLDRTVAFSMHPPFIRCFMRMLRSVGPSKSKNSWTLENRKQYFKHNYITDGSALYLKIMFCVSWFSLNMIQTKNVPLSISGMSFERMWLSVVLDHMPCSWARAGSMWSCMLPLSCKKLCAIYKGQELVNSIIKQLYWSRNYL